MRVKICGITRREDAELAIELGADAIGFVYEPASPRYVGDDPDKLAVPHAMAPYAQCVAVYGNYQNGWSGYTGCNVIQYADGDPWPNPLPYVLACRMGAADDPEPFARAVEVRIGEHEGVKGILLDAYEPERYGGTGNKVDWNAAAGIVRLLDLPVILAGGLTPDNVAEAIRVVQPYAVDVSSGVELSAGVKDSIKLRDFIVAAKRG